MTIWRMCLACCTLKATNTHSEYVSHFFPLQQRLHKRASLLLYRYICYVKSASRCIKQGDSKASIRGENCLSLQKKVLYVDIITLAEHTDASVCPTRGELA